MDKKITNVSEDLMKYASSNFMNSSHERLTTVPAIPAFHAGWLWLHKIAIANAMSLGELIALLPPQSPVYAASLFGTQIDLEHLAVLMECSLKTATSSFPDTWTVGARAQNAIFHCPDCLRYFFEASVTASVLLDRCPVHNQKYVRCEACLKTFATSKRDVVLRHFSCPTTGVYFDQKALAFATYPPFESEMTQNCQTILNWLRTLRADEVSKTLLAPIFGTKGYPSIERLTPWVLGAANSRYPAPTDLLLSFEPAQCELVELAQSLAPPVFDELAAYRVALRHIRRQYLRQHSQCLTALLRLAGHEREAIDISGCCPFALAYLSWRCARESRLVDELCEHQHVIAINLPHWIKYQGAANHFLIFALILDFLRLWHSTLEHISSMHPFRIQVNHSELCSLAIFGATKITGIRPNIDILTTRTKQICRQARKEGHSLINSNQAYLRYGWNHVTDRIYSFTVSNFVSARERRNFDYILA